MLDEFQAGQEFLLEKFQDRVLQIEKEQANWTSILHSRSFLGSCIQFFSLAAEWLLTLLGAAQSL